MDEGAAKRFLTERITSRAQLDGAPLSAAEQYMLGWSESDPDFVLDPDMNTQFEQQATDQEFETKIRQILRRAYDADLASDAGLISTYRAAVTALAQGDHYLSVMIDPAIGVEATAPWRHTYSSSLAVALRSSGVIVGAGLLLFLLQEPRLARDPATYQVAGIAFLASFLATLFARLLGARTMSEASSGWGPGQVHSIGGIIPVAVISALVAVISGLVLQEALR